ncbi:MAG TPA: hypothetical protein VL944_02830 [Candidatus Acidoferrum sp.]|nr:hypothetical protein [Candidatus Acidoferrum sp.]
MARTIVTRDNETVEVTRISRLASGEVSTTLTYESGQDKVHVQTTITSQPWEDTPHLIGEMGGTSMHSFDVNLRFGRRSALTNVSTESFPMRKMSDGRMKDYPPGRHTYMVGEDEVTRSGLALISINQVAVALREAMVRQEEFPPAMRSRIGKALLRRFDSEKKAFDLAASKADPKSEQVKALRRDMMQA